jgi:hypothetical protein
MPLSTFLMRRNAPDLLDTHSLVRRLRWEDIKRAFRDSRPATGVCGTSSSATHHHDRLSYEIDTDLMSVVLSAKKKDSPLLSLSLIISYTLRSTVGGGATAKGGMEDESMDGILAQAWQPQREKPTKAM